MQNRAEIQARYAKRCKKQGDGMQKRGTTRRDRRPRLSEPVGRNITALSWHKPWWRSMNFTPSMYDFYHSENVAHPVGRGLASRRKATHTAMQQKRRKRMAGEI